MKSIHLPFITLLLLISFASVNAVLFTPALPDITGFFAITEQRVQDTITWFLIGYTLGQLVYGPIANRLGRKRAMYIGISMQIISSLLCAVAAPTHAYWLLVLGRFSTALGAGVGLKMTFTLVNECYDPKKAVQKISYLMLAFAITPGLSVAIGGLLNGYWGWSSCFYLGALYGVALLYLVQRLPETQPVLDLRALHVTHMLRQYRLPFTNNSLIMNALLMGIATAFIYTFATLAPFIAINVYHLSASQYGLANAIPAIGLILGSLSNALLATRYTRDKIIILAVFITAIGVLSMFCTVMLKVPLLYALFIPMLIINLGVSLILANASTNALAAITDKAHGSAVMSFINMGFATCIVLSISLFAVHPLLLPTIYLILLGLMLSIVIMYYGTNYCNASAGKM